MSNCGLMVGFSEVAQALVLQGSYSSGKTWKKALFEKSQGKPGKLREFYSAKHNSWRTQNK